MKIALIGPQRRGGGTDRMMAYYKFLKSKNNDVEIINIPKIKLKWKGFLNKVSISSNIFCERVADTIKNKIVKGKYDVVIGIETNNSYVLTKKLECLKIFSWEAPLADELRFNKKYDQKFINKVREKEIEICMKSDYVVFPWKTTQNYVRKCIYDGDNFLTIKFGCYPKQKITSYFFPPSIIYLGTLSQYWVNKNLLSYLSDISPYDIDVYGRWKKNNKNYRFNYKGFSPSLDIFYNYQFGLNTVSKDILRKNHFSSKIITYLSYGLPVLFPEWQKFPHELKGCVPYNEQNFVDVIKKYVDIDNWKKLSMNAINQASDLDWNITLKTLEKIINK